MPRPIRPLLMLATTGLLTVGPVLTAGATVVDPCAGWTVVELATGLGMVENLEPDGRGGLLLSSSDRDQIERLLPDGTLEVAFADVPAPGGLRVRDGVLFANTGDAATSGAAGTADGTIQRIDLASGVRETWAEGLTMPNGLVFDHAGRAFTSRDIGLDAAITMVPTAAPRTPVRWAEIRDSNGLAVDAAGEWLYVATTFDPLAPVNRVRLDDPMVIEHVADLTTIGVPVAKGLDDMTFDGADVLYLTANGSGEVLRLDPATGDACVLVSGLGNPTAVKLGDGVGFAADHLFVTAWDGIVRELVPPAGAAPTPLPGAGDGGGATVGTTDGTTDGTTGGGDSDSGGGLAATGGGAAVAGAALLGLAAVSGRGRRLSRR